MIRDDARGVGGEDALSPSEEGWRNVSSRHSTVTTLRHGSSCHKAFQRRCHWIRSIWQA